MVFILAIGLGALIGFLVTWFWLRSSYQNREFSQREQIARLETKLEGERQASQEKLAAIEEARSKLEQTFKALSADALKSNNESFLKLAEQQLKSFQESAQADLSKKQDHIVEMVRPVQESLAKVDSKIQELEKSRAKNDESIIQQVQSLIQTQKDLRSETSHLVAALRAPQARGRWGEMQLKRVVEMAGMIEFCDFWTQESVGTEEGRLRPDLVVKLPGGKNVVVDAKTPLNAFLEALQQSTGELKEEKMKEHSRHIRRHIEQLSRKSYWAQFQPAPEFVVLFLPGEAFFSAALEQDPSLIEMGVNQNVIMATPTTLIALLRSVAYGWRQERLKENADAIAQLGKELYKRLADMGAHMGKLGKSLETSIDHYNRAVGTMESRVLVTARRFKELESDVSGVSIEAIPSVDKAARQLQSPELSDQNELMITKD